jgi:hypothetical protein
MAIDAALCGPDQPPSAGLTLAAFSLADRAATARILERAGFGGIRFSDVHEPVFYGPDIDAAMEFIRSFESTRDTLAGLTDAAGARALERLRAMIAAHDTGEDGVVFDSRAWLITAHRL